MWQRQHHISSRLSVYIYNIQFINVSLMCHVTILVIGIKLENGVVFWSIDKMNNVVKLITLTSFVCFRWCLLFPYSYLEPNITDFIYECGLNINFEEGKPMLPIVLSLCISSMVLGLIGKAAYMAHRMISTASPMTTEQIWGAHFTNDFSIVIEIRWKIVYVAIYFLAIISLQRFAHATIAHLVSWEKHCDNHTARI